MVNLGPYTTINNEFDDGTLEFEYCCAFCNGVFNSYGALYQHCKMTSLHEWCGRCERALRDEKAFDAHLLHSKYHNFCPQCDRDFPVMSRLHDHQIEDHHWCHGCDTYYENDNNLRMARCHAFNSFGRFSLPKLSFLSSSCFIPADHSHSINLFTDPETFNVMAAPGFFPPFRQCSFIWRPETVPAARTNVFWRFSPSSIPLDVVMPADGRDCHLIIAPSVNAIFSRFLDFTSTRRTCCRVVALCTARRLWERCIAILAGGFDVVTYLPIAFR